MHTAPLLYLGAPPLPLLVARFVLIRSFTPCSLPGVSLSVVRLALLYVAVLPRMLAAEGDYFFFAWYPYRTRVCVPLLLGRSVFFFSFSSLPLLLQLSLHPSNIPRAVIGVAVPSTSSTILPACDFVRSSPSLGKKKTKKKEPRALRSAGGRLYSSAPLEEGRAAVSFSLSWPAAALLVRRTA